MKDKSTFEGEDMIKKQAYHIYPVGDLRDHETDGKPCWCKPKIENDGMLVVHHSMDEREKYETGERKPN